MITTIYIVILAYFLLGAAGFWFISREKTTEEARHNLIKYLTYFLIINILFFSIVINSMVFRCITILIVLFALGELFNLFRLSGYSGKLFFFVSLTVLAVFSAGFIYFSGLDTGVILFSFLILSIFDSFSQICGQLWGRRKILPRISPGKTQEGLIGGTLAAILSALLLKSLTDFSLFVMLALATGVVVFAFTGDMLASLYKRRYQVKDYSKLIPGHGGFLDRFDSLIAGGAWVAFFNQFISG